MTTDPAPCAPVVVKVVREIDGPCEAVDLVRLRGTEASVLQLADALDVVRPWEEAALKAVSGAEQADWHNVEVIGIGTDSVTVRIRHGSAG